MTISKRFTESKTEKYHRNIDKRGKVPKTTARSKSPFTVRSCLLRKTCHDASLRE